MPAAPIQISVRPFPLSSRHCSDSLPSPFHFPNALAPLFCGRRASAYGGVALWRFKGVCAVGFQRVPRFRLFRSPPTSVLLPARVHPVSRPRIFSGASAVRVCFPAAIPLFRPLPFPAYAGFVCRRILSVFLAMLFRFPNAPAPLSCCVRLRLTTAAIRFSSGPLRRTSARLRLRLPRGV